MENDIYIKAYQHDETYFSVDVKTLIIINVYRLSAGQNVALKLKLLPRIPNESIRVDMSRVVFETIEAPPEISLFCVWPIIIQENYLIAGLCSVARQIIKCSQHKKVKKLLGFRDACLMSCSEASIWTKFCEIDMIESVTDLLNDSGQKLNLPPDMCRFEYHLSQPVRMHNIYKVAQEKNGETKNIPIEKLVQHTFSEGPFMTLSDVILFTVYQIFFNLYPDLRLRTILPLTTQWFETIQQKNVNKLKIYLTPRDIQEIYEPDFIKHSLYTSDPARYKPEKRIYTKQKDITNSLRIINNHQIDISNSLYPFGDEIPFDWSKIPKEINPVSGSLPEKRAFRKCDQLENLAKAVIKLTLDQTYRIVDFCSGSGHLGLLLAHLLPKCSVILVENKEMSLVRAKTRIANLNLTNIVVLQSNLDYFVGNFDIGVSLHACGVATDLVMQNCIKLRAHFVCCPCCYGGIHDCYHLKYPRSVQYQDLNMELKDYLTLAHAADQTHDTNNSKTTQGFLCMDAIDTDRKLYAENCGYTVHLGKLHPVSCTNKNNLLVGVCRDTL